MKSTSLSWQMFESTIQPQTSYTLAWKKVKTIMGYINHSQSKIEYIKLYTNQEEIVNIFELISSSSHYSANFQIYKANSEHETRTYINTNNQQYKSVITFNELETALTKGSGTSPGANNVSYEIIVNLTPEMKCLLLKIF